MTLLQFTFYLEKILTPVNFRQYGGYDRHPEYNKLVNFAKQYVRPQDAEDVLQNVFVWMTTPREDGNPGIMKFDERRGKWDTWFHQKIKDAATGWNRKNCNSREFIGIERDIAEQPDDSEIGMAQSFADSINQPVPWKRGNVGVIEAK